MKCGDPWDKIFLCGSDADCQQKRGGWKSCFVTIAAESFPLRRGFAAGAEPRSLPRRPRYRSR